MKVKFNGEMVERAIASIKRGEDGQTRYIPQLQDGEELLEYIDGSSEIIKIQG